MKNLVYLSILSVFLFTGCVREYNAELPESDFQEAFNYETIRLENVSLELELNGTPLKGVLVKVWNDSPLNGGEIVIKALTDANGKINSEFNLPVAQESYVIEIGYIGLPDYLMVSKDDLIDGVTINENREGLNLLSDELVVGRSVAPVDGVFHTASRVALVAFEEMGTYNSDGVPDYLEAERDVLTADLISFINASLPESKPVPTYHPRYIQDGSNTNLDVIETSDVWVTFVHEGAGYKNTIGYYTYSTGNEPTTVEEVGNVNIVYPNLSFHNSGGNLIAGDKVYLGRFEPGTTIGFALFANGWNGSNITHGIHQIYSNPDLNPESTDEHRKHTVLLWDEVNELFLIGFEDQNRDVGSDLDFNDAILYVTSNPVEGISTQNVNPIDKPGDTDKDGVNDIYDEFPEDPEKSYQYVYPAENTYGTFAFEDQWPLVGDYDFNDLVIEYQYTHFANAQNKITSMDSEFIIKAVGAGFKNAFGFQMNSDHEIIESVNGNNISGNLFSFNSNGTETNQSKAVIIVSDNVHQGFDSYGFINTSESLPYQTPDTVKVNVLFTLPQQMSNLGSAPYNPFLVINQTRGREVHLPSYVPTDLADRSYFGTSNDDSDESTGIYYKTKVGLPWGMNLPQSFDYPMEKTDIRSGYDHFNTWAQSGGFSYMDWYMNKPGYRSTIHLFKK